MTFLELGNTKQGRCNLEKIVAAELHVKLEVEFKTPQRIEVGGPGKRSEKEEYGIGNAYSISFGGHPECPESIRVYYYADGEDSHTAILERSVIKGFVVWLKPAYELERRIEALEAGIAARRRTAHSRGK